MIAKLQTGNGFGGALRYALGRKNAKVLAADGVTYDYDANGHLVINARQVAKDFRLQTLGYNPDGKTTRKVAIRKPVYHWVLSWKVGEEISDEAMTKHASEFLTGIGFVDTQFVIIRHQKQNQHCHIICNVVNNYGQRLSTHGLVETAHKVARDITISYGYAWGEPASDKTIKKAHKPHEQIRYLIEDFVFEAVDEAASIEDLPRYLERYGVECRIKYSAQGKAVGISFACTYDDQQHTFKGSDLDRRLSAANIVSTIDKRNARKQAEVRRNEEERQKAKQKAAAIKNGYNSVKPIIKELIEVLDRANQLFEDTKAAGITLSSETSARYKELRKTRNEFHNLLQQAKAASDMDSMVEAIGVVLALLNPLAGIMVMLVAGITRDIRKSSEYTQKRQLLVRVESIRNDIDELQARKAENKIEKQERLQEILDVKRMLREYREGLNTIDNEVTAIRQDLHKIATIQGFVGSVAAAELLARINATFPYGKIQLVPGPLEQTDTGYRWQLNRAGLPGDPSQPPKPQEIGKSYIDFRRNSKGEWEAIIEADNYWNHSSKGVSGKYNLTTGECNIKARDYKGLKSVHDKKPTLGANNRNRGGSTL